MQCPACKHRQSQKVALDADLEAIRCESCGGHWIAHQCYEAWRAKHPADIPETPGGAQLDVADSTQAKLCPTCGRIMLKYKVGHGLAFAVEYCGGCGGVWLDRNEWEALRKRGLHDNLLQIFSSDWQARSRAEDMKRIMEAAYTRRFGPADYEQAKATWEWIHSHPEKRALAAFLMDEAPYAVTTKKATG